MVHFNSSFQLNYYILVHHLTIIIMDHLLDHVEIKKICNEIYPYQKKDIQRTIYVNCNQQLDNELSLI